MNHVNVHISIVELLQIIPQIVNGYTVRSTGGDQNDVGGLASNTGVFCCRGQRSENGRPSPWLAAEAELLHSANNILALGLVRERHIAAPTL